MPQTQKPIELMGAPGSPYTRKMLAILRYRHIPYRVFWSGRHEDMPAHYPMPKVKILPTVYFPEDGGALEATVDSTPIIRRLEQTSSGRSVLPPEPVTAFLNYLIEDYADEWLTKAMFHFRWAYQDDIENAAALLTFWHDPTLPAQTAGGIGKMFAERQINRLYVVGSNDTTGELIEEGYARLLIILDTLLQKTGYLFGNRPSSTDFSLYGQLTQLTSVDPTPTRLTSTTAPRLRAWTDRLDDLSGLTPADNDWLSIEDLSEVLKPLLTEIGTAYAPLLMANSAAIANGQDSFETEIHGKTWQQPVFPYQAKCLAAIRMEYDNLSQSDKSAVCTILSGTGCDSLLDTAD